MYSTKKFGSLIFCWVLALLILILTVIMNMFARGVAPGIGIFDKTVAEIMDESEIDMVPASWVQWYWIVIGTWQFAWLIYFGINICRQGINDEPLIVSPTLISVPVFVLSILANIMNITGLFLWDIDEGIGGLVCMSVIVVTMWMAVVLSCSSLSQKLLLLNENGLSADVWFMRFIVQNGLAIYASFCTVVFFIQLDTVIKQEYPAVDVRDSTTIYFSILVFFIVMYFICDVTIFDRWLRYIFTPYASVLVILSSIIERNWGQRWLRNYRNPAYISSVLGVVFIFTVTKILLTIGRGVISPGTPKKYSDTQLLVEDVDDQEQEH